MAVVLRMRNERGIALATVLMITMVVLTLMVSAAIVSSNTSLLSNYRSRETVLAAAADAGIEEARSALNGTKTLMPDTGYKAIETNAAVYNAAGTVIPNVTRTTYVGPTGITSGQYGIFGSVVVVVKDAFGNMAVRRSEVVQESFAKYAYFTDNEGGNICFANGDQLYGPVHSNDVIQICSSGAGFHSQVTTAQTITGKQYGTFYQGYVENGRQHSVPDHGRPQQAPDSGHHRSDEHHGPHRQFSGAGAGQHPDRVPLDPHRGRHRRVHPRLPVDQSGVGGGGCAFDLHLEYHVAVRPPATRRTAATMKPASSGRQHHTSRHVAGRRQQRHQALSPGWRGFPDRRRLHCDDHSRGLGGVARGGESRGARGSSGGCGVPLADQPRLQFELQGRDLCGRQRRGERDRPGPSHRRGHRQHRHRRRHQLLRGPVPGDLPRHAGPLCRQLRGDGRQHPQLGLAAQGSERRGHVERVQHLRRHPGGVRAGGGARAHQLHGRELR